MASRFAASHPLKLFTTPLPALAANTQLGRWRRQGQKVLVMYVDHEEYLPFILPIWEAFPSAWASKIKICVVSRSHATIGLRRKLSAQRISPALYVSSWSGGLLTQYDLFLTTHQGAIAPVFGRQPRVCVFHGLPAKGGTFVESQWRFLDGAFLIGPLQRRLFEDLRQASATGKRLWAREIGYPKSDALINGQHQGDAVLKSLGLDASLPTVLYAPSWEENTSLRDAGTDIVKALVELPINVIVKLHPMSYYPRHERRATGGVDWKQAFAPWHDRSNFRHVQGGDVAPLVAAADVLVTDVSSVAYESILLDRPVIYYDTPMFFDKVVPQMYAIDPQMARDDLRYNCGREAGVVVKNCQQLCSAVKHAIADPTAQSQQRRSVREQLLYHPGTSAQAAVKAIGELLSLPCRD